jgi:hypothetical protein
LKKGCTPTGSPHKTEVKHHPLLGGLVVVNTHTNKARPQTAMSNRTQVEQLDNFLLSAAYFNVVIVPFTLIASARSLAPASPILLN